MLERVLAGLDDFATRWHALPVGHSVTLPWDQTRRPPPAQRPTRS